MPDLKLPGLAGKKSSARLPLPRIAAIQASKRTAELIPLCHPLYLTHVAVEFNLDQKNSAVECMVTAETFAPTGIRLLEKQGGHSGHWQAA